MEKDKKMVAAISAVMQYLETEQAAVALQATAGAPEPAQSQAPQGSPAGATPIWGISGRQAQMQYGSLMQLKSFHGVAFR